MKRRLQYLLLGLAFTISEASVPPLKGRPESVVRRELDIVGAQLQQHEVSISDHGRFQHSVASRPLEDAGNTEQEVSSESIQTPPIYYCRDGLKGTCSQFSYGMPDYGPPEFGKDSFSDAFMVCSGRSMNVGLSDSDKRASFGVGPCPEEFIDPGDQSGNTPPPPLDLGVLDTDRASLIDNRASGKKHRRVGNTDSGKKHRRREIPPVYTPTGVALGLLYFCRHGIDGLCYQFSYGQGNYIASNYPTDTLDNARTCCSLEEDNVKEGLSAAQMVIQSGIGSCPVRKSSYTSTAFKKHRTPHAHVPFNGLNKLPFDFDVDSDDAETPEDVEADEDAEELIEEGGSDCGQIGRR